MRSRKLQYLHVNDFTSDFKMIPGQRPRLLLKNLGRPLVDIRICDSEFQNFFRFQESADAQPTRSCIVKLCDSAGFAAVGCGPFFVLVGGPLSGLTWRLQGRQVAPLVKLSRL